MNIVKFEEKVVETIENSNLFKDYKKYNSQDSSPIDIGYSTSYSRNKYHYYVQVDETHKVMQFSLNCESSFSFGVTADTYNELFSLTLKILKSYITGVSKTKEETSEEGKGE